MIHNAIRNLYPELTMVDDDGTPWTGDALSGMVMLEVDQALVDAEMQRLTAEYEAQEYARNRKAEYDALNQFELISDDSINGTTTHKDAILAIKAKYPKPK